MNVVSYGIINTNDDVIAYAFGGPPSVDPIRPANGVNGFYAFAGLRFQNIAIPNGATIYNATLTLRKDAANSTNPSTPAGSLRGVASDNAPEWTVIDPISAEKTASSVTIIDGDIQNYDVTSIIQEIVGRPGWVSGNSLAMAGDTTGASVATSWFDYNTSPASAAQLNIAYYVGTPPPTTMTFEGASSGTTTPVLPAHQAGDLLVCFMFRDGNTTAPALPAGWTSRATGAGTTCSYRLAYKLATSSSESGGGATTATTCITSVYRPAAGYSLSVGANNRQTGTAATLTYPALTLQDTDGSSWIAAAAGHRSTNTAIETPPSGMNLRLNAVDTTDEAAVFDTSFGIAASSWPSKSVTLGGTASGWIAAVYEIKATATGTSSRRRSVWISLID